DTDPFDRIDVEDGGQLAHIDLGVTVALVAGHGDLMGNGLLPQRERPHAAPSLKLGDDAGDLFSVSGQPREYARCGPSASRVATQRADRRPRLPRPLPAPSSGLRSMQAERRS